MALNATTKGEVLLLTQSVLWSLFPIVTILSDVSLSPLYGGAIGMLISSLSFASILTVHKNWKDLLFMPAWRDIALAVLLQSVLFYLLVFTAIHHSTAGNISIIGLMEVFFTYLFLGVVLRQEPYTKTHAYGAICMVIGAMIVLLPGIATLQTGDLIMLVATMIAPIGNFFAKRARKKVSSECVMFYRAVVGGFVLLCIALLIEPMPTITALHSSLPFLLINGLVLMGYRVWMWLEAIHFIPLPKAISLTSITPMFTLVFAYFILHETIEWRQVIGILPILIGVYLLTRTEKI